MWRRYEHRPRCSCYFSRSTPASASRSPLRHNDGTIEPDVCRGIEDGAACAFNDGVLIRRLPRPAHGDERPHLAGCYALLSVSQRCGNQYLSAYRTLTPRPSSQLRLLSCRQGLALRLLIESVREAGWHDAPGKSMESEQERKTTRTSTRTRTKKRSQLRVPACAVALWDLSRRGLLRPLRGQPRSNQRRRPRRIVLGVGARDGAGVRWLPTHGGVGALEHMFALLSPPTAVTRGAGVRASERVATSTDSAGHDTVRDDLALRRKEMLGAAAREGRIGMRSGWTRTPTDE